MSNTSSKSGIIDKIIFITLITFTLIGVAITNISPAEAHLYWLVMSMVFAIAAIITGWQRTVNKKEKTRLVTSQLIHWGSTMIAVMVVYGFLHSGQIQNETVSLVIVLILALSTFLAGLQIGWQFFIVGILLAISAVIISYMEEYIWLIVMIAFILVLIAYFWNKFKKSKTIS